MDGGSPIAARSIMTETFYHIRHSALYKYPAEARSAYGRLTIIPRDGGGQNVFASHLLMDPWPSREHTLPDYLRNTCTYVQFDQPHTQLQIQAESIVRVTRRSPSVDKNPNVHWDSNTQTVLTALLPDGLMHCSN